MTSNRRLPRKRLLTAVLVLVSVAAGCLALWSFGVFAADTDLRAVPAGHQEIAFLAPATSADSWERLVAAVDALCIESRQGANGKSRLHVDKQRAFVDLTADVPELSLWVEGADDARLWIRWYKLTAEFNTKKWISRLTERSPPPLAVVGGDTSSRALRLAETLNHHRGNWQGTAPLLFITTATVDRYIPHGIQNDSTTDPRWPKLIDVYQGRSFRFSFTNTRMAQTVLDFVGRHDDLWPSAPIPATFAAASAAGMGAANGNPLATATAAISCEQGFPIHLYTLKWNDDSFSADLADRFGSLFERLFGGARISPNAIEYSVGDFYQPNPREAFVAGQMAPELKAARDNRQLLLLPASTDRARRFLHTVIRRLAPEDWRNLVVITGDSVSFNTIYRDRDVAWNIHDLPVPLVAFSHRNPVDETVGFKAHNATAPSCTGTEDLLLYRDILETLLMTAYRGTQLTASADDVNRGLRELRWQDTRVLPADGPGQLLFHADGNRNDGTGEHVMVLQPQVDERGTVAQARIKVWRIDPSRRGSWAEVKSLDVGYDGLPPVPQ